MVSFDGSASHDLLLTWNSAQVSGQYPFLEGFDHVVLRNVSSTRLGLNLVAPGIEPWSESWYNPPLPDDCITPPKWRRVQLGAVNVWMRLSDRRSLRAESVDTQVAGAQMGEILAQEYTIGYIHSIPFVGEAVMIGEAAGSDHLAARLDELLTPFRRVRVVAGGGRGGAGVSTYIEALDGRFSIRVTHNQVGRTPVGNPPAPRIDIYDGAVSGHGTHVVLPNGTTLEDILRALRLL